MDTGMAMSVCLPVSKSLTLCFSNLNQVDAHSFLVCGYFEIHTMEHLPESGTMCCYFGQYIMKIIKKLGHSIIYGFEGKTSISKSKGSSTDKVTIHCVSLL